MCIEITKKTSLSVRKKDKFQLDTTSAVRG